MDLELTPTPTSTKSTDDTEIDETPQHTSPLSFTSGGHKPTHQPAAGAGAGAYRECMKNHAASIGGHAVDGCGEFMPSPAARDTEPTSLKCAACGCHRSFHRREPDPPTSAITPPFLDFRHPSLPKRFSLSPSPPPQAAAGPISCGPQFLFSLSTAVAAEEHHQAPVTPTTENPVGRKRFRTKFSQEQKEKMHSFSEKLGWKMQKSDEAAVIDFCHEIGVAKGVLKVWMHNNKNTFGKKEINGGGGGGGGGDIGKAEERKMDTNGGHFQNYECGNGAHFHSSNNGSSSPPR